MDTIMSQEHKPITFNSPLEAGIRAVSILGAAYPQTYDLQRLVALDYLLVHTGDIDGPDNLHPPTPMRSAELLVRRKLVEQSLLLMMTRDLVERAKSHPRESSTARAKMLQRSCHQYLPTICCP